MHKPSLKNIVQIKNEKPVFCRRYLIEEAVYNRNLKEIAKLGGILKNITNKVADQKKRKIYVPAEEVERYFRG